MRSATMLVQSPDFAIRAVLCRARHARWSAAELVPHHGVVLVRRGRFRLRQDGQELLAEPTTAYAHRPGAEIEFSHPVGGDVCTAIAVSPRLWTDIVAEPSGALAVPIDGRLELAHRQLLRTAGMPPYANSADEGAPGARRPRPDAAYACAESLVMLLRLAGERLHGHGVAPPYRRGRRAAALAQTAKEAILADDPAARELLSLARRLGVSPAYLSRTFHAESGLRLTSYRNRVRVSWALDRIEAGERDLARLAADLRFADQAHMTRTIKAEVGQPPAVLRRILHAAEIVPMARPSCAGVGRIPEASRRSTLDN